MIVSALLVLFKAGIKNTFYKPLYRQGLFTIKRTFERNIIAAFDSLETFSSKGRALYVLQMHIKRGLYLSKV